MPDHGLRALKTGAQPRRYLPAAGHDWLLPLYDPIQWLLGGDSARRELLAQAGIRSGQRILDIGCGTGSLAALVSRLHPEAQFVGLDPDPRALARAERKVRAAGSVRFDRGYADELPYPPACFDRVFSSFMLHHLGPEEQRGTLREVRRVLAPDGSFHVVDFAWPARRSGGLAALLREAAFAEVSETGRRATIFGRIGFYRASAG